MVKCCANYMWYVDIPKNNRYGDVDHVFIKSGMYMTRKDSKKDLTKYQFTGKWARERCSFEPDVKLMD